MNIKTFVDKIVQDGKLTREEHLQFLYAVQEDGKVDNEEREQINRIFNMIKNGEIKVE
jgi:polyhydroxyalkanoate synthesis regulator phasin